MVPSFHLSFSYELNYSPYMVISVLSGTEAAGHIQWEDIISLGDGQTLSLRSQAVSVDLCRTLRRKKNGHLLFM